MAYGHLLAAYLFCCVKVPVRFDKSLHFDANAVVQTGRRGSTPKGNPAAPLASSSRGNANRQIPRLKAPRRRAGVGRPLIEKQSMPASTRLELRAAQLPDGSFHRAGPCHFAPSFNSASSCIALGKRMLFSRWMCSWRSVSSGCKA